LKFFSTSDYNGGFSLVGLTVVAHTLIHDHSSGCLRRAARSQGVLWWPAAGDGQDSPAAVRATPLLCNL